MKLARTALTISLLVLMGLGYAASQVAVFQGRAAEFAKQIDQPPIRWLALVLFIGAIALAFAPRDEEDSGP